MNDKKKKEVLLKIRNLKIEGYTDETWVPIIKGVDLTLHRGEVMGLIGESGAGKSTIGAAAMGYARDGTRITPDSSIEFDGMELTTATEGERRGLRGARIAYVAQSAAASFNPAHKIIDQHTEAPLHYRLQKRMAAQEDAIELYNKLRLPNPDEIGFRYPHQVSGGQLQRAMTAMAMSCRPDLIIFDEPTTALDVTTQIEVLAAIRDIVDEFNTAALYITHDLAVVAQMADTIKVLLKGEEVEEAPTKQMLDNPKEDYTKSLWAVRSFESPQRKREGREPLIEVKNVDASYASGPKILDDVSFDIYEGMTVAVVGESGSGKSTTARVITGLLPPEKGEVLFKGQPFPADYKQRNKEQLRQCQMIYQMADTALNPKVKISEIIGRPAKFYSGLSGAALKNRVDELLDLIELEPSQYYNRYPPELSGGQKQRIGIARALAAEPSFIVCDEVTSALDQLVAEGILRLLDRLQDELNLAYMFITHDLATVRSIADEVVVMQHGKVVEQGPKDKMFTPPHHPYTDLLLSSVPEMDPEWLTTLLEERGLENLGEAASDKIDPEDKKVAATKA
ncbi:ABC transporter ATP-binding protein [Roseovarius nanhaiticus]|uniref:Peptide/nickel transport system ATP-binding protein n=1 Tax=Roseovarius nanhaiticus TaxID=573024 RepID=A0A1N7FYX0_9RHOB|nr:ABC transporter ATP-binding protein [Roseovarius nanhaiticus]SEK41453.1 peptide/nickel transport system ATP-binding protein [Roseovarius nanhaiticus]SIS05542.1 peptide/nickel transport system ATP-binding protein [Roseovarius nanhaiticus]